MIRKFTFGDPIPTEAILLPMTPEPEAAMPWLTVTEAPLCFAYALGPETAVFGLGQTVRGINKRGWTYTSFATDDACHDEDKHSLYCAHNFLLVADREAGVRFGAYFDYPGKITFDLGYTRQDRMTVTPADGNIDVYLIEGDSLLDIVHQFRQLIGTSYIPPKWAFGYGQSRWSYMSKEEVRELADAYQAAGIPLEMVYLDIDYMERFKDFTINQETFGNFPEFVAEMKDRGIHLVPIIDAGVKKEEGYDVYEEGKEKGYFVKKADGSDYVIAVWPGLSLLPDFLREDVRRWFGDRYQVLTDAGIDGFWNDMNEPSIFYSQEHLKEVLTQLQSFQGKNLDLAAFGEFNSLIGSISNNPAYYDTFYHQVNGQMLPNTRVHNLYGYNMSRAAAEGFRRNCPDKRILMFSRSSFIGMHRHCGIWTGDNKSWWSHLLLNLQQMPGINMCGFLYSGADMGGFGADTTEDLLLRWTALSLFTPLMRNHSAMGTRRQELYRFPRVEDFRNLIRLRYSLIPYLYSEFMKAALEGKMYFTPLAFVYENDERCWTVEDQLLVGESIMIAPVYQQNARGRMVYLPEDMRLLRFRSHDDYDSELLQKGDHYIPCALNEVLIFLRKGHTLPLAAPADQVSNIDYTTISYFTYKADEKDYILYNDDGITPI